MAAERHAGTSESRQFPGGWKVGRVPARGARRVWGRAVAGTLSAGGLAAALSIGLVVAGPGASAGATGSHAKTVKISTAKVSGVGTVLTTSSGLTLYRFTEDTPGTSACSGACAKIWPPLLASKGSHVSAPKGVKGLALTNMGDGHWQVTFHKLPLYRFEGDKKKGQAHGQNVGQVWFAALKSGIPATPAAAGGTAGTPTTAPGAPTTQPVTPTTQGSGSGSSSSSGSSVTSPTSAPTPAAQPTTPVTQPPAPPTTTPPTSPPPTTTPTTSAGSGGYGY